jgi:hypothetical protein
MPSDLTLKIEIPTLQPRFDPRSWYIGFLADRIALGQVLFANSHSNGYSIFIKKVYDRSCIV